MNKREQKARLKDILSEVLDVQKSLEGKKEDVCAAIKKAQELEGLTQDLGIPDTFDIETFEENLFRELFIEEFSDMYEVLREFKGEIEDIIGEASARKAEELEDRYAQLEDIIELFNPSSDYDSIENALDYIDEAIDMLKNIISS